MKRLLLSYLSILWWLLLTVCTPSVGQSNTVTAQFLQPLVFFQKSPCLGTCPAYNAMIYENGSVSFVGYKNALAQDTLLLQLSQEELNQLEQKIKALAYRDLQNSYLSNWSDISSTYLTFYEEGKEVKRVRHEAGGPQQLIEFQEWLHTILWQRAEKLKKPPY